MFDQEKTTEKQETATVNIYDISIFKLVTWLQFFSVPELFISVQEILALSLRLCSSDFWLYATQAVGMEQIQVDKASFP